MGFSWACSKVEAELPVTLPKVRDPRIPALAYRMMRVVRGEINYYWGLSQKGVVFNAQIHQESRWIPDARSPYASGLAQFTPATAEWISKLYPADLGANNPLDVRWAIKACIIFDKRLYDGNKEIVEDREKWGMTLSAYNGGSGNLSKDRRLCRDAPCCCDQFRWFGHVEKFSGRAAWAFKENRDYVVKILDRWSPMYEEAGFR